MNGKAHEFFGAHYRSLRRQTPMKWMERMFNDVIEGYIPASG